MVQCRQHLRLTLEPREHFRIVDEVARQGFDSNLSAQFFVAATINLSHAAGPDQAEDFARNPVVYRKARSWRR